MTPVEEIKTALSHTDVLQQDEISLYVAGKRDFMHVRTIEQLTRYTVHPKRNKALLDAIGIKDFARVSVHDGWIYGYSLYLGGYLMAKALEGLAFNAYCRRLAFKKGAREMMALIRSSPPSRHLRGSRGNENVSYPSEKMQCIIKAESGKVEFPIVLEYEHSDDVLEYYEQPPPIELEYLDRHKIRRTPLHTPDFFVFRYNSAGWEECKATKELVRLAQEKPNRIRLDEHGKWRCPPGEEFAERLGFTYTVRASAEINWVAQDNWLYLEQYYQDLGMLIVPEDALEKLYQLVDETPGISLTDLCLAANGVSADQVNIAIAKHFLYVDLLSYRLTDRNRISVPVFRDRRMAYASTYRGRASADLDDVHIVTLAKGSTVSWDGRELRIAFVGETEVTLVDSDGNPFPLVLSAFKTLCEEGKIVGTQTSSASNFTEEGRERLALARECDFAAAVFRNRVIHPEDYDDEEQRRITSQVEKVPPRTKRDWQKLYQDGEIKYGSGLIGLIPDYSACGGAKLDQKVIELIESVLKEYYDTATQKIKRGAYGEYLLRSKEKQLPTVSQTTFYARAKRHLATYDQTYVREGARAAYPYKDYYRSGQRTTNRHGVYAWAKAHIDHTELNLQLFDSATGKLMGKCWLTMMILSHPRRIVAAYLSYDPPSYRSCMAVIRLCVKRYKRLPAAIVVDGGPEFQSTYFEKLLALFKIRKHKRPASEPRFGSVQERLFGTMETDFIYHLVGNTQASKQPRKLTKATDPKRLGVWTLPALAGRVNRWAFEEYDNRIHPILHQTPKEAYDQSMRQDGERNHKTIAYDDAFIKATFPTTKTGYALVQPGTGVRMKYLDYWCEEMRDPTVERTKVRVRYDPFDVTVGYAYIDGRWRECQVASEELAGCSERELQIIAEEIRKKNRILYGREQIEITQSKLATDRRKDVAVERVLRQQQHDREAKAALAVLEGARADLPKPPLSQAESPKSTSKKVSSDRFSDPDEDKLIIFRRYR
jgi:putative transposase